MAMLLSFVFFINVFSIWSEIKIASCRPSEND